MIPEGWEVTTLGHVCLPNGGLQTGPFGSQLHASEYAAVGIPVIMPKDMSDGRILEEKIARIPPARANELEKHMLHLGDIVFSRRGDLGRYGYVTEHQQGWICGTGCIRARLDNNVAPEFLVQHLNLPQVVGWLEQNAVGQTMLNLNTTILAELPLRIPKAVSEQRKIAEILGTWDAAIVLSERLIAALQHRKQGLMQRLLTGEVRFAEFEGSEWEEVYLGDVFIERKERDYSDLPLLSITDNEGVVYRDTLDRRDTSNADKSNYLRICPGDIGYNTMRMWQGRSAVSQLKGIVSPAYTICTPHDSIDVDFMGYSFKFPPMIYTFWRYSQGLVSDTLNLKYPNFAKIKVVIPPFAEQQRIAAVLQSCDYEMEQLGDYIWELQQQKKGLMQRLLTGEIRVAADQ